MASIVAILIVLFVVVAIVRATQANARSRRLADQAHAATIRQADPR